MQSTKSTTLPVRLLPQESVTIHNSAAQKCHYHQANNPALSNPSRSPPASTTALTAAWLNRLLLSAASFSLLAFVFELPEGATPLRIFPLSCGVKFTNPLRSTLGGWRGVLFVDFARRWREVHREREVEGPRVLRRAPLRGSVRGGPGEGESERVRGRRWGV